MMQVMQMNGGIAEQVSSKELLKAILTKSAEVMAVKRNKIREAHEAGHVSQDLVVEYMTAFTEIKKFWDE